MAFRWLIGISAPVTSRPATRSPENRSQRSRPVRPQPAHTAVFAPFGPPICDDDAGKVPPEFRRDRPVVVGGNVISRIVDSGLWQIPRHTAGARDLFHDWPGRASLLISHRYRGGVMERRAFRVSGFIVLTVVIIEAWATLRLLRWGGAHHNPGVTSWTLLLGGFLFVLLASGFFVLAPNEARVVLFLGGRYVGSVRDSGFHWTVPFSRKRRITLRVRNFESAKLKVSDCDGNPVEIAAVVVWRVVDSAKAAFGVDDFVAYVAVQAEAAVRHMATLYPYESHDRRPSLRDSSAVTEELNTELRERVSLAGVEVLESRITHLAYAPEIAQAMLARQQASAIVAARSKIVEGAVGMVSAALERLRAEDVVDLDEERKAQMVANLLVVLCGDRAAQPVVNTGTLYG